MFLGLGCACLLAMGAAIAPRLVFIIMWIFGTRVSLAFDTWIWPLLGVIFVPYTTIMYVLVWTPAAGIYGWDWLWIGLGLVLDIMKWGQIYDNRHGTPYYGETVEVID